MSKNAKEGSVWEVHEVPLGVVIGHGVVIGGVVGGGLPEIVRLKTALGR